ncbi:MAG: hypothetical protein ACPGQQ_02655 [Candidatus Puniceispirillaceae bacterium]
MSYTNINVHFSVEGDSRDRMIHNLQSECDYWKKLAERHHADLENIPKALQDHGHVDFYDHAGRLIITAVPQKEEETNE